ncbi:hypothetical protein [Lysobacter sp. ESA13C]|uniref:hypothetical protein n=1 Tax=Lysobacter sp. ESA13C TaxID=2862676 RepID=UPI001CBACB37|nr:hypothetical protein [Lysobacter sp. ESA13C]
MQYEALAPIAGREALTLLSFSPQIAKERGLRSMTLDEYNRLRAPSDTTLLFSYGAIAFGLLGSLAHSTTVAVATIAASVLILIVLAVRTVKRLDKADQFRCPSCAKIPHQWVADNPSDDRAYTDYQTDFCLHCRFDLRRPVEPNG